MLVATQNAALCKITGRDCSRAADRREPARLLGGSKFKRSYKKHGSLMLATAWKRVMR